MAKSIGVRINNPLPARDTRGVRFPRWHAKNPANGVVVPASVAPTIKRGN